MGIMSMQQAQQEFIDIKRRQQPSASEIHNRISGFEVGQGTQIAASGPGQIELSVYLEEVSVPVTFSLDPSGHQRNPAMLAGEHFEEFAGLPIIPLMKYIAWMQYRSHIRIHPAHNHS